MDNPWSGIVSIDIDGTARPMSLTLGALAELEATLGDDSLVDLVSRFESGAVSSRDVFALIIAGLRGGGWDVSRDQLLSAEIKGGPIAATRAAAQLLARAFLLPEERTG